MVSFKLIGSGESQQLGLVTLPCSAQSWEGFVLSVDIPGRIASSDLKSVFEVSATALWLYIEKGQSRGNLYS